MQRGTATIIIPNEPALRVAASSARISTQIGSALDIFQNRSESQKDLKLVEKVLSSGHKSVIEHQTLSIAFDDVSVLVEQFAIEFRLASFTVKSRRYVDFSNAGYVVPVGMSEDVRALYGERCDALFGCYQELLDIGIPKEDARFVLPYGFRSNFYMTLNARELIRMVTAMLRGRGSAFAELRGLGEQLKAQFDRLYPNVIDAELAQAMPEACETVPYELRRGDACEPEVTLVDAPAEPVKLLDTAMRFSRRFDGFSTDSMRALINDARPRELELLQYSFRIDNISLACITHFTRHRMMSLMLHHELSALSKGDYLLPKSIAANAQAEKIYRSAFERQSDAAIRARELGIGDSELAYFAMAGHLSTILISMNARELLHFAKLRTCSRAQWEIRRVAREMIELLNRTQSKPIFCGFGPTCAVTGKCPEGKMCCGHPVRIVDGVWKK